MAAKKKAPVKKATPKKGKPVGKKCPKCGKPVSACKCSLGDRNG